MGKAAYGWMIMKDENIPGTVVRTSTIPEELGRLVYLLTDKTGATLPTCTWRRLGGGGGTLTCLCPHVFMGVCMHMCESAEFTEFPRLTTKLASSQSPCSDINRIIRISEM